MFESDSETEFNYDGGMSDGSAAGGMVGAFLGGLILMLIIAIALVTTDNAGWMDARTWPLIGDSLKGNAAAKAERLSAVWKNERLTSKDPEFKGAYERTCGGRANGY